MTNYTRQNISHFAICKFWMVQQWSQMVGKANVNQSLKFQPMSNFELNEWSRNHWRRCTMLLHEAEECKNISRHWKRNLFIKLYFCWVLIFLFSKKLVADKLKPHRCEVMSHLTTFLAGKGDTMQWMKNRYWKCQVKEPQNHFSWFILFHKKYSLFKSCCLFVGHFHILGYLTRWHMNARTTVGVAHFV